MYNVNVTFQVSLSKLSSKLSSHLTTLFTLFYFFTPCYFFTFYTALFKKVYFSNFLLVNKLLFIDLFTKRHRLVHNGRFPKFEALYCSSDMISSTENLSYKAHSPLWTRYLVAMYDDIGNRPIYRASETSYIISLLLLLIHCKQKPVNLICIKEKI